VGFVDTKDLGQRADVCMGCHVGPNNLAGPIQVVDHDLIAAGHPRLSFEFHSYFESLPAHWNRRADKAPHAEAFHFRSWLAGQTSHAGQRELLKQHQPTDFAQLDCYACHHQLLGATWRRPSPQGPLTPVTWPGVSLPNPEESHRSAGDRLSLVRALLAATGAKDASWDTAVRAYLASRAVAGDLTREAYPQAASQIDALHSALARLGEYLGKGCFIAKGGDGPEPTQYDSPTSFAPGPLKEHLQAVSETFQRLEGVLGTTSAR